MTPEEKKELEPVDAQQPEAGFIEDPSEEEIGALAHELWVARGCPEGSADEDWFRALEEIRTRRSTAAAAG